MCLGEMKHVVMNVSLDCTEANKNQRVFLSLLFMSGPIKIKLLQAATQGKCRRAQSAPDLLCASGPRRFPEN